MVQAVLESTASEISWSDSKGWLHRIRSGLVRSTPFCCRLFDVLEFLLGDLMYTMHREARP
jgi:hypothetical protein